MLKTMLLVEIDFMNITEDGYERRLTNINDPTHKRREYEQRM
ncbi:hypothetical protein [Candidatus Hodgkinia cicadicola]